MQHPSTRLGQPTHKTEELEMRLFQRRPTTRSRPSDHVHRNRSTKRRNGFNDVSRGPTSGPEAGSSYFQVQLALLLHRNASVVGCI